MDYGYWIYPPNLGFIDWLSSLSSVWLTHVISHQSSYKSWGAIFDLSGSLDSWIDKLFWDFIAPLTIDIGLDIHRTVFWSILHIGCRWGIRCIWRQNPRCQASSPLLLPNWMKHLDALLRTQWLEEVAHEPISSAPHNWMLIIVII